MAQIQERHYSFIKKVKTNLLENFKLTKFLRLNNIKELPEE
ncbi:MAG: hypothetical protein H6Q19_253 [Bacteroidetes bacterium]|nr:hypothetical protein [Bacteroidota bacterium]